MSKKQTNEFKVDGDATFLSVATAGNPACWAIIDTADLPVVMGNGKWSLHKEYVSRADYSTGKQKEIYLHRQVMGLGCSRRPVVDHIDHDPLNNRRSNLRVVSQHENAMNARHYRGKSLYRGVWLDRGKWRACIRVHGTRRSLGSFATEEQAAEAYNRAAAELVGPVCLNEVSL